MTLTAARQVADAVLYEGYLLYPYRASSSKNQVRWQFGVLGPDGAAAAGVGEEPAMSAEVLLEPRPDAHRRRAPAVPAGPVPGRAARATGDGWEPVDELLVGGTRWIPFHEACRREVAADRPGVGDGGPARARRSASPVARTSRSCVEGGALVGRLVRTRWPLAATVT